ncbi:MAG: hypothetical protein ACKVZ6_01970 [Kineosporiaceae bacterium]
MALVAVASAKGSPGVTTLAVALAGVLPGPVLLADLDPAGSDVWLRYRDRAGHPLDPDRGLLSLAAAAHRGTLDLGQHVQVLAGGLPVLLGLSSPEQAVGLGAAWPHIDVALGGVAGTVVADCGRFTGAATPGVAPFVRTADAVVLVARGDAASLAHLRERVRAVHELRGGRRPASSGNGSGQRAGPPASSTSVGVVVVAPVRERGAATDVQRLLDAAGLPARVLGHVADDPRGALALSGAGRGAPGRTDLVRSVRGLVPAVTGLVQDAVRPRTAGVA